MSIYRFLIADNNVYLYNKKRKWRLSRKSFESIMKELKKKNMGIIQIY